MIAEQRIQRRPQARTVRGSGKKKPSTREGSDLLAERKTALALEVLLRRAPYSIASKAVFAFS